jgi:hypothetical protein
MRIWKGRVKGEQDRSRETGRYVEHGWEKRKEEYRESRTRAETGRYV